MGGAEVFTREVAKNWALEGNEVTLFTSRFPGSNEEETVDGVKIFRAGGALSVYWHARRFCKKHNNFDVVIDEINTIPFFAPIILGKRTRVFALIHQLAKEYWFYETPFPINYIGYYFLENKMLAGYKETPTITVSESTKSDLINLGFKQVYVVPEGLAITPPDLVPPKSLKPVVIFSGRLKSTKRPDHAIKAFRAVREKVPNAELWMIGDGPLKKSLKASSGDGIKFFGHLSNFDRQELVKQSWVLVNPGLREGWGLNIIEANAFGVPSVAYSVPGLWDSIQNGKTGILVPSGDYHALANGIIELLTNVSLRKKYSENALAYSKSFRWSKTSSEFMKVIIKIGYNSLSKDPNLMSSS